MIDLALEASEPASDAVIRYVIREDRQIRFSNGQIDISKIWKSRKMDVFVALGKRVGSTEIENPTADKISSRVSRLISQTGKMRESELFGGISHEGRVQGSESGLIDPDIEEFGSVAPGLVKEAIASAEEKGARRVAGSLVFGKDRIINGTNHGEGGEYDRSYYELTVRSFIDNETSGQGLACGRDLSRAEDRFVRAGRESAEIASMAEGGVQGEAGVYDLIASPTVSANLLGGLASSANPLMMMLGFSPLDNRLGQELGPRELSIRDDPDVEEGLGCRPWDVEGVPSRRVDIFDEGRFVGMVHNTSTAELFEADNTGSSCLVNMGGNKILAPWASNLVFEPGDEGLQEMIEGSRKPTIYVTSNWYTRFSNYSEGTFSTIPRDGIFLIEDGEIKRPVRKIRISDNIVDMISRIESMGNDIKQVHWWEVDTPTFIPHVKFNGVNITAASL